MMPIRCVLWRIALLGAVTCGAYPALSQQRTMPGFSTPQMPGPPISSITGPDVSDPVIRAMRQRRLMDNFHKMQRDSARLVALALQLQAETSQPKPSAAPEADKKLAEVEKLSKQLRELMSQY